MAKSARKSRNSARRSSRSDAIRNLALAQAVYGYIFEGTFYDIGRKLDYLRATVEIASEREDLRAEFLDFLADFVIRKKLV